MFSSTWLQNRMTGNVTHSLLT